MAVAPAAAVSAVAPMGAAGAVVGPAAAAAPPWAAALQKSMDALQSDVRRLQNGLARHESHPLAELPNAVGQLPSVLGLYFPPTLGELNEMTNAQASALMTHYDVPLVAGHGAIRCRRSTAVGAFLGVRQ